ncbi:putative nuclease HARBI1 [Phymastichus coffea]|uniref:putative nuclease HARBI1 n=1 Tax=Phymastichus coffea TaxID=108790 RepID=UPI00273CECFC|nr:putative nuclease HARBI1 [Phymastichus coffea]
MSAMQMEELLLIVGPYITKQFVVREPIPPNERLALTLRYLASGDYMQSISQKFYVSGPTVSNIVYQTCQAIWAVLQPLVLPANIPTEESLKIARGFQDTWQFPNCIGAIDGKHVRIQCPPNAGSQNFNYKGYHSIVLLAVCDANYLIRCVDIGAYGRRSDGGIFSDCVFGQKFESNDMNVPEPAPISTQRPTPLPYCLVGDEAFPAKSYMQRPYPKQNLEIRQCIYNYRLSCARRTIENTFGILVNTWRVYHQAINASGRTTIEIVKTTVCLHNWLRKQDP